MKAYRGALRRQLDVIIKSFGESLTRRRTAHQHLALHDDRLRVLVLLVLAKDFAFFKDAELVRDA